MHICLFILSKYEVSLFHLYIAFYAILITASSYNKNNEYDMSETLRYDITLLPLMKSPV